MKAAGKPAVPHSIVKSLRRSTSAMAKDDSHSRNESSAHCQIRSLSWISPPWFSLIQASAASLAADGFARPVGG
jgi:hypothetical protein